jgi:hypothetical protein
VSLFRPREWTLALGCLRLLWFRFDVLEADQFPNFHIFMLRVVAWIKRKPLTVTWHEVWGHDYWRQYLGRTAKIASLVEWLSMRLPDRLIAASDQTAERLRGVLGERASISVVPNGIDLNGIRNSYPEPAKVDLVTVGRFLPHKNIAALLDSVALLHASGLPVTCRVIGEGPLREALQAQAERLGIAAAIDFRHDVWEQKDVYALMKAARVAVFPTLHEEFGIAVLEAIACGLPVVTTSAPYNLAQHLVARSSASVVRPGGAHRRVQGAGGTKWITRLGVPVPCGVAGPVLDRRGPGDPGDGYRGGPWGPVQRCRRFFYRSRSQSRARLRRVGAPHRGPLSSDLSRQTHWHLSGWTEEAGGRAYYQTQASACRDSMPTRKTGETAVSALKSLQAGHSAPKITKIAVATMRGLGCPSEQGS